MFELILKCFADSNTFFFVQPDHYIMVVVVMVVVAIQVSEGGVEAC